MKYKVEERCKKCGCPNHVTVYEGLTDDDIGEINPCQCVNDDDEEVAILLTMDV